MEMCICGHPYDDHDESWEGAQFDSPQHCRACCSTSEGFPCEHVYEEASDGTNQYP